jgi:NAD(P)H-dependent flavin oxidoreductase YrpB (nitropropane dioxygenase family)
MRRRGDPPLRLTMANRNSAWNRTRVSNILRIEYPIIQGPLGGFSSQRLTAAVSNFGGLGSFGAHGLAPSAIQEVIAEIRSLTNKPFAMNLWISMEDGGAATSDAEAFERALSHLAPHLEAVGASKPRFSPYEPLRFEDQVRVLLDAEVPAFSFIYGIPPKKILEECHRQGILTIGTATTQDEAIALEQAGVDVVVASGFEAGGHRGSFLRSSEDSLTGTISLVPQIVDAVAVPVVAAESPLQRVRENGDAGPVHLFQKLRLGIRSVRPAALARRGSAWAGQSAGLAQCPDVATLLQSLVDGVFQKWLNATVPYFLPNAQDRAVASR